MIQNERNDRQMALMDVSEHISKILANGIQQLIKKILPLSKLLRFTAGLRCLDRTLGPGDIL